MRNILAQKARQMQQPVRANLARPPAWVGFACLLVAGCGGDSPQNTANPTKPFAEISLTVRCPDPAFARAITPAVESWGAAKGAKVAVEIGAMSPNDSADVGIIPAAEFGQWAS